MRENGWDTYAYESHEVMLNIDDINIFAKAVIFCDIDLTEQIVKEMEELKVNNIEQCALIEHDVLHLHTEADVSANLRDISGQKKSLKEFLDTAVFFSGIPIETWSEMGSNKENPHGSRIHSSASDKGAPRMLGRTPILVLNMG